MSNLSQFFGGGGIKSIQTFESEQTITNSGATRYFYWGSLSNNYVDITISQIDEDKTILIYNVGDGGINYDLGRESWTSYTGHFATILNSTTIRVSGPQFSLNTSFAPSPVGFKASISVQVIEFN